MFSKARRVLFASLLMTALAAPACGSDPTEPTETCDQGAPPRCSADGAAVIECADTEQRVECPSGTSCQAGDLGASCVQPGEAPCDPDGFAAECRDGRPLTCGDDGWTEEAAPCPTGTHCETNPGGAVCEAAPPECSPTSFVPRCDPGEVHLACLGSPGRHVTDDCGARGMRCTAGGCVERASLTVLTMNTGTTKGLDHDRGEDDGSGDGYTQAMAELTDAYYENSVSWNPAEAALTDFIATVRPTIAAYQELFYDPWCEDIPVDPELDFVCRDYTPERPLQIERLMGADYQIACADGQDDNCVAVRRDFGSIVGCPQRGVCLDGLEGMGPASGCSRGARIGRLVVELVDGRNLTVVNVHGTSGFKPDDMSCRADQFRQIFEDRGDGEPAASGQHNLILGDFNTDPVMLADTDESAAYLWQTVAEGERYHFISPTDRDAPGTYTDLFRIDHVISDAVTGQCLIYGGSEGTEPVFEATYFDHRPVVCEASF